MASAVVRRRTPLPSGMPDTSNSLTTVAQLSGHGFVESVMSHSSALAAPSSDPSS
jgi:hypothetical protein